MFAALINLSQFFIIGQTGPVSSTVVGHLKTCLIVALGWLTSGRSVGDKSIIGVFIAVGGIVSWVNQIYSCLGARVANTKFVVIQLLCFDMQLKGPNNSSNGKLGSGLSAGVNVFITGSGTKLERESLRVSSASY